MELIENKKKQPNSSSNNNIEKINHVILDSKKNMFKEMIFTIIDGDISRTIGYSTIFNWFEIDLNFPKEKIKENFNVVCIVCGNTLFD
jgi:hypothetical protein